ncbi:hypothetical protein R77564_01228 [Ralstonia sp. LMG 32965]|uniref:Uncharacterized protein n=1 Tax=Ralstonia flatus TaxID=3058601 RepID=A0ABM9KKD1_9RALS|nr:hypothetical protein R77564_01228 [Ralstonia sp. LMG 32965]
MRSGACLAPPAKAVAAVAPALVWSPGCAGSNAAAAATGSQEHLAAVRTKKAHGSAITP